MPSKSCKEQIKLCCHIFDNLGLKELIFDEMCSPLLNWRGCLIYCYRGCVDGMGPALENLFLEHRQILCYHIK